MLGGDEGIARLTLQGRLQSLLEKGPSLPASGLYLRFIILEGQCTPGLERKQVICSIPQSKTKREVQEFLGAAGFCHIWIPGYSSLTKTLYKTTAGSGKDPLNWRTDQERASRR
jgi:hypothetical protein